MTLERICIKFFAEAETTIDDEIFIPIFHEWIRYQKLGGILLDVADYRHVPNGPGVMLITHNINFSMDYTYGGFGLLAQRKTGAGKTHRENVLELVQATVAFGALLESDSRLAGRLNLQAGAFHYMANDRLLAPNTAEGYAAILSDLQAVATTLYPGQTASISRLENDPRERLTVLVEAEKTSMGQLAQQMAQLA